jgi:hypothetical protein
MDLRNILVFQFRIGFFPVSSEHVVGFEKNAFSGFDVFNGSHGLFQSGCPSM